MKTTNIKTNIRKKTKHEHNKKTKKTTNGNTEK